jgi:DNA processing protein
MLGVGASGPLLEPTATPMTGSRDAADAERDAWTILAGVDGLGPVGFAALLDRFRTGREVLRIASGPSGVRELAATPHGATAGDRARRRPISPDLASAIVSAAMEGDRTLTRIRELGLSVVTVADATYPSRLAAIELPPALLFVLGNVRAVEPAHAIAVVGTRRPSDPGRALAARIAAALVSAGATVVSGLAVGIDGAVHDATVASGGSTVAVIGGGHATLYPRAHRALADAIVAGGGAVVSELAPDTSPTKGTFPRRNRVISGLSDATVVVEAPARSGALITASWALEQGRECFVVPGAIGARESEGCLAFLREFPNGARIVAGVPQLLADLGLVHGSRTAALAPATISVLGETAGRIAARLVDGLATVDELVAATGLPVATVLATLTLLERDHLAVGVHGRFRPAGTLAVQLSADPRRRPGALARSDDPMLP